MMTDKYDYVYDFLHILTESVLGDKDIDAAGVIALTHHFVYSAAAIAAGATSKSGDPITPEAWGNFCSTIFEEAERHIEDAMKKKRRRR